MIQQPIAPNYSIPFVPLARRAKISQDCLNNWCRRGCIQSTAGGAVSGVQRRFDFMSAMGVMVGAEARRRGMSMQTVRAVAMHLRWAHKQQQFLAATAGGRCILACFSPEPTGTMLYREGETIQVELLMFRQPFLIDVRQAIVDLLKDEYEWNPEVCYRNAA